MKFSFTLLTVLAGLAIANPTADASADAPAALDRPIEVRALDGNCVRCVRRGCGNEAVKCLRGLLPSKIIPCLALKCADDLARCCILD